jgi:hypothetical protein
MLNNGQLIETFQFETLGELRDFLNRFKSTDLSAVYPASSDHFTLKWYEEVLSDNVSTVNDCDISS